MRRLLQLLAGVGLLSTLVGCHCMTGVCDCEPHGCGDVRNCAGCGAGVAPAAAPTMCRTSRWASRRPSC